MLINTLKILRDYNLFRKIYLINIFFTYVIFLDLISYVVEGFMMAWGIFIIYDKFKNKQIKLIKNHKLIISFLICALITTLIQIKMCNPLNTGFDFIMLIHFCICFFIFYGLHTENKEKIETEIASLMQSIVTLTTIFVFISFLFIIFKSRFNIRFKIFNSDYVHYCVGMHLAEGVERFAGVYTNPNLIAFCCVVCIIFSHTLFIKNKFFVSLHKHTQIALFVTILLLSSAAIILSDSVASFIMVTLYIVLILFYNLVLKNRKFSIRAFLKNFFIFLTIGITSLLVLVIVRGSFQNLASEVINGIYSTFSTSEVDLVENENITIGRGKNYDIKDGSGRRHLLKQALRIFTKNPLMGIGIGNIEEYGKIYFKSGVDFSNFHNGYVSVAVSYGLVGLSLFMAFLLCNLFFVLKALKKSLTLKNTIFPNLSACVASYCVYSLFEKTMLSEISYMGIFFWLMLGYTTAYASTILKLPSEET